MVSWQTKLAQIMVSERAVEEEDGVQKSDSTKIFFKTCFVWEIYFRKSSKGGATAIVTQTNGVSLSKEMFFLEGDS